MSESDQKEGDVRKDAEEIEESTSTVQADSSPLASDEAEESFSVTEQQEYQGPQEEGVVSKPQEFEPGTSAPSVTDSDESADSIDGDTSSELFEKKWYVVHTYSGYENKARQTLLERIKRENVSDYFGEILIPTEEVVEMKRGKRRTSKRKFFPGYMLVQMKMIESSWYLVKSTPKITGFVGDSTNPPPMPEIEVKRIASQIVEGAERVKPKIIFEKGDTVRIVDGPFVNFNGVIDDVESEKGKLRVLVSIFGRATPVEIEFVQVEKI